MSKKFSMISIEFFFSLLTDKRGFKPENLLQDAWKYEENKNFKQPTLLSNGCDQQDFILMTVWRCFSTAALLPERILPGHQSPP